MNWCIDNVHDKTTRKNASHIGGDLADYMNGEMLRRIGRKIKSWQVVNNGIYKHLYFECQEKLKRAGARIDEVPFSTADQIGDLFETGITVLLYSRKGRDILRLLELCLWTQEQYSNEHEQKMTKEEAERAADATLKELRSIKILEPSRPRPGGLYRKPNG